jgi:polyhydroxyalkanoate synthesis regulator protein
MTTKQLKEILDVLLDGSFQAFDEEQTLLDEDVAEMIDETAENIGLTQKEALEHLMKEELEGLAEGEKRFKERAKACGMPMTRKEYEERKAEREKERVER